MAGNDFIEFTLTPASYVSIGGLLKYIDTLPLAILAAPHEMKNEIGQQFVFYAKLFSPVDTQALRDQTDFREAEDSSAEEMHLEVFSSAENVHTGYYYARARAFGFNIRGVGPFWEPPEVPPYPEQASAAAMERINFPIPGALRPFAIPF